MSSGDHSADYYLINLIMSIYVVTLLVVVVMLWRQRGNPVGASTAFLFIILIFHGPALFFFTEVWGGELEMGQLPYLNRNSSSFDIIHQVYLAMSICLASVLVGMGCYSFSHPSLDLLQRKIYENSTAEYKIHLVLLITKISLLTIGVFLLVQFVFVAPPSELYRYYLSDINEFEKVAIRRSATLAFYPYNILLATIFPFVSFILIAQVQRDINLGIKRSKIKQYAIFLTLLVMLAKLSQYNKSGPIIFALQILFVVNYAKKLKFGIGVWHLKIFLMGLIAIVGVTAVVNSDGSWILTLFSAFDRVFMIPNEVIFEYFYSIPEHLEFSYGSGISWISFFTTSSSQEAVATYWKVGEIVRGEFGSTSNSFFIADAWSEFSWYGIVAFSIFAGWLIRWYDHQIVRWGTSPVAIALVVSAYNGAYTLGTTALTTAMLTGGLVLTPMFARILRNRRLIDAKVI